MINHLVFAVFSLLAVVQDVKSRKIKNKFNLLSAIVSMLVVIFFREISIKSALMGFFSSFIVGILLWIMGVIRAGDAKFLWTLGILKGFEYFWISIIYIILLGGIIALGIIFVKKDGFARIKRMWAYLKVIFLTKKFIRYEAAKPDEYPFTIPIAIGGVLEYIVRVLM